MKIIGIVLMAIVLSTSQFALAEESTAISRLTELQQKNDTVLQLDDLKLEKIKLGCSNAQQSLNTLAKKTDSANKKRNLLYGDIQKESKAMEFRLTKQGVDTSELDLLIGRNQQILDDMNQDNKKFQKTTEDLLQINCQENPALFYFGITYLREQMELLKSNDDKIYVIVRDSNNDTFKTLANRLVI